MRYVVGDAGRHSNIRRWLRRQTGGGRAASRYQFYGQWVWVTEIPRQKTAQYRRLQQQQQQQQQSGWLCVYTILYHQRELCCETTASSTCIVLCVCYLPAVTDGLITVWMIEWVIYAICKHKQQVRRLQHATRYVSLNQLRNHTPSCSCSTCPTVDAVVSSRALKLVIILSYSRV